MSKLRQVVRGAFGRPASGAWRVGCWGLLSCWCLVGCGRTPVIEEYEIPRKVVAQPVDVQDRMLGAIIPLGGQGWFFKASGSIEDIDKLAAGFEQLVRSVKRAGEAGAETLEWTLPPGWREAPGEKMRRATFTAEVAPQVDISLINLPMGGGDLSDYVLANVNRWRGQLDLPPTTLFDMPDEVTTWDVGGLQVRWVDLRGKLNANAAMPGAPFAGGAHPPIGPSAGGAGAGGAGVGAADSVTATDSSTAGTSPGNAGSAGQGPSNSGAAAGAGAAATGGAAGGLTYTVPEGWQAGRAGMMRKAAFLVKDGAAQVEITVIDLSGESGGALANINRWREQVSLEPITAEQLPAHAQPVTVDGMEASYVDLVGTATDGAPTTIQAVIAPANGNRQGRVWFIKLMGDAKLAERERERFLEFAKSIRFGE